MIQSLIKTFFAERFAPFVLIIAVTSISAFEAEARTPKLNHKTYVGTSGVTAPDDSFPTIRVLYDKNAFDQNGTERWIALQAGAPVIMSTQYQIGIWDGYITDLRIGHVVDGRTGALSDLFVDSRAAFTYPSGEMPPGYTNLLAGAFNDIGPNTVFKELRVNDLPASERDDIVAACNARANAGNGYRVLHNYSVFMRVYTRARRRKGGSGYCVCPRGRSWCKCNHYGGWGKSRTFTISGAIPINIQCNRPGSNQPAGPAGLQRQPEITNASLSIKTSGKSCPKQPAAEVRIFGEGKRKVRYRILRKMSKYNSRWFEGRLKKTKILGGEGYALVANHKLKRKLGPGEKKFRLEIQGWKKTKWQTVKITCPPLKAKKVVLSVTGSGKGVICPRHTSTEIEAPTNGPGEITFQLREVGGVKGAKYKRKAKREGDKYVARYKAKNKAYIDVNKVYEAVANNDKVSNKAKLKIFCIKSESGKLTLRQKPGPKCQAEALVAIHTNVGGKVPYELECGVNRSWQRTARAPGANKIGVDKISFGVKNNERVTCILRTRLGGQLKSLGGASKTFRCSTLSSSEKPNKPARETSQSSQPRCLGGDVRKNTCLCSPNKKRVKIGKNAFRCKPKKPSIICQGGHAKPGGCVCPRRTKKVQLGPNRFQCEPKRQGLKKKRCRGNKIPVRGKCIRPAG